MEGTENLPPITRASKKRHAEKAVTVPPPVRVFLADLTNVPKFPSGPAKNPIRIDSQKSGSKSTLKKNIEKKIDELKVDPEIHVEGCADDSHKYADAPLIYHYLRLLEMDENKRPMYDYMENVQKDITPAMREILVDWLTEVADEYKLTSDTLYLSVNYIDRKFEEITPPHVEDICYMTDNTYPKQEVVDMEIDILKILNYEMGNPTTKSFLRIFTKAAQDNSFACLEFEYLASYVAELSLLDYICVRFLPSMIAASAIFLARLTMLPDVHPWSVALEKYTGYKPSELESCVLAVHDLQTRKRCMSVQAVRDKYMQPKFKCVGASSPPSEIPRHYFNWASGEIDKDAQGVRNPDLMKN